MKAKSCWCKGHFAGGVETHSCFQILLQSRLLQVFIISLLYYIFQKTFNKLHRMNSTTNINIKYTIPVTYERQTQNSLIKNKIKTNCLSKNKIRYL